MSEYKYTNKGTVNTFDLSQLTPEELTKFNKMNDKQKIRFIAAYELTRDDDMPEVISLKNDFISDENVKQNTYSINQRKLDEIKEIINKHPELTDIDIKQINLLMNDLNRKISQLENSVEIADNENERIAINDELSQYEKISNKLEILKEDMTNTKYFTSTDLKNLLNNNNSLTLKDIKTYLEKNITDALPYINKDYNIYTKDKSVSSLFKLKKLLSIKNPIDTIIPDLLKSGIKTTNEMLKAADENNTKKMDELLKNEAKRNEDFKQISEKFIKAITDQGNMLKAIGYNGPDADVEKQQKFLTKEINDIKTALAQSKEEIFKEFKTNLTEFGKMFDANKEEQNKLLNKTKEIIDNIDFQTATVKKDVDKIRNQISDAIIEIVDSFNSYGNTMGDGQGEINGKRILEMIKKKEQLPYYDARTKEGKFSKLYPSLYDLYYLGSETLPDKTFINTDTNISNGKSMPATFPVIIQEEKGEGVLNGEGYGGFSLIPKKIKDLSKAPSDIIQLKNEITQIKAELENLKKNIGNSMNKFEEIHEPEESKEIYLPPPPPPNVPAIAIDNSQDGPKKPAQPKPQIKSESNWLDDILKARELKHVEETKPLKVESNELNDLQKAMEQRRKDIEPDEYSDDDDEWGEGVMRLSKNDEGVKINEGVKLRRIKKGGIPRRRMLISDYLSMF